MFVYISKRGTCSSVKLTNLTVIQNTMSSNYIPTDNSALAYVLCNFRKINKLGRWCEQILSYKFTVAHIKGKDNTLADFLSRNFPLENCNIKIQEVDEIEVVNNMYRNKIGRRVNRCTNATLKGYVNNINELPVVYIF